MHTDSKPRSGSLILAFLAVYVVWGSTYLAMRFGVESFPPLLLAGTRFLTTGVILYPVLRWKTGIKPTAQHWKTASITGVLLLFIGNGGVCWAEQTVPSGVTALLVAMVTLWMVLVDWLRPGGYRPSSRGFFGIILGFAGLALLVGPSHFGSSGRIDPIGAGVLVLASLSWACGSLYSKHGPLPGSAMLSMAMQCLAGGVALWIGGVFTGGGRPFYVSPPSMQVWLAAAVFVVFRSGGGFSPDHFIFKKNTGAGAGAH